MNKLKVRLRALLLLIFSPVLIPIAAMKRCQVAIFCFYLERYSEVRTGRPYNAYE